MTSTLLGAAAFWAAGLLLVHHWRQEMRGLDLALARAFKP